MQPNCDDWLIGPLSRNVEDVQQPSAKEDGKGFGTFLFGVVGGSASC